MATPFYVSPEQVMKDKSDYARKGIARGRSVLTLTYTDGIVFAGENPSNALHKISEIYDRIAFAAVGKYNEFENLRLAGVRYADLRGYQYDRRDVTSRGLANAYAQTLGTIFTESGKPYEVELVVAEVGERAADDQLYRLTYDGSVAEEHGFVVMGGNSEPISTYVKERHDPVASLEAAVQLAVAALSTAPDGAARTIAAGDLEVAVLDRNRPRRAFQRLLGPRLERLLGQETTVTDPLTSTETPTP
ncbi:MAG: proteasome subunit alpha [Frankiales bacterium]|nr:proteasome subunit alpha [Frankiales bacterium]